MALAKDKKEADEHFKSRLVDDVFGKDNQGKVHMEKVAMLIWQFRDDPSVVEFMALFVAKFASNREVFDGIEFYLPQLAHMIIHLEADWDDAILERLALVISQQSLHFALQFNWILQGAIEDYQPETSSGEPNPGYNSLYYSRCVKLLTNIERCVIYGKPRSHELQRLYERGKISKKEYQTLEQADRRFNAEQITALPKETEAHFGGLLLYKRKVRTGCCKPKPWKERYFTVDDRMLYCWSEEDTTKLVRAMPLEGAIVEEEKGKYPHMFAVSNRDYHFRMRASTQEEQQLWIKTLREESTAHALFQAANTDRSVKVLDDLTPAQRDRYNFFKDERDFIRDVCDVAERLRFKDPAERKVLAPNYMRDMSIPPCCYVPMCNSTDIWQRVSATLPKDTRVFNTNERCPVIMYFVTKRGEKLHHHRGGMKDVNLDVAEYMHLQFEVPDPEMQSIEETSEKGGSGPITPVTSSVDLKKDAEEKKDKEESKEEEEEEEEEGEPKEEEAKEEEGFKEGKTDDFDESEMDDKLLTESINSIWSDDKKGHERDSSPTASPAGKGNRMMRSFMAENLVRAPSKIVNRIQSRRISKKKATILNSVKAASIPIITEAGSEDEADSSVEGQASVVSVRSSSILNMGGIILGDMGEGDIDRESIERAKAFVCHGESYAEKTARMLKEVKSDGKTDEEGIQIEIDSVMAKSNDDLRQEVFVMQMIHYYKSVFANAELPLWLKTYRILSTSKDTGLIEVLSDATSIDGLKKSNGYPKEGGLRAYFEQVYGSPDGRSFKAAQTNFMQSLAAYSIVSYLLGLKDRHNGNIMIDLAGHLIFIDFGFAMGMAPGHEFSFERAPFKLTKEYVEVMGGPKSKCFAEFKRLFVAGFKEARKSSRIALGLVEIMMYKSNYPCFTGFRYGHGVALKGLEKRLMLNVPDKKVEKKILRLISKSTNNSGTLFYDWFQYHSNGYAM